MEKLENPDRSELLEISGGGIWDTFSEAIGAAIIYSAHTVSAAYSAAVSNHTKYSGGAAYQNRLP